MTSGNVCWLMNGLAASRVVKPEVNGEGEDVDTGQRSGLSLIHISQVKIKELI